MNTKNTVDIVDKILDLVATLKENNTSLRLPQIHTVVEGFKAEVIEQQNNREFDELVSKLNSVSGKETDLLFRIKTQEASKSYGPDYEFRFNNTYSFLYRSHDDMNDLLAFIGFLSNKITALKDFSVNTSKEITVNQIELTEQHVHREVKSGNVATKEPSPLLHVDGFETEKYVDAFDARDEDNLEARKQHNVEHLKNTKQNVDDRTAKYKQKQLDDKALALRNYTSLLPNLNSVVSYVELWLSDMQNDKTLTLTDFTIMCIESQNLKIDRATMRVIIETVANNLTNKLKDVVRLVPSEKNTYIPMSTVDKENLVALSLSLNDLVKSHLKDDKISISVLAVNIIDYSHKNSSIDIIESPEELARLASTMYGVMLSKNLDPSFIYSADINNQHDIEDKEWLTNNKVIKSYIDYVHDESVFDVDGYNNLNAIAEIINNRDKMMTTSRLTNDELNRIFENVDSLLVNVTGDTVVGDVGDNGVCLLTASYNPPGNTDHNPLPIVVVIMDDCAVSITRVSEESYIQEFYTAATAIRLVRWLHYLTSKLEN